MYRLRKGLRFEYREQEGQRVKDSPSLSDKFPQLMSLSLDLGYYNSAGVTKNSQIKHTQSRERQVGAPHRLSQQRMCRWRF